MIKKLPAVILAIAFSLAGCAALYDQEWYPDELKSPAGAKKESTEEDDIYQEAHPLDIVQTPPDQRNPETRHAKTDSKENDSEPAEDQEEREDRHSKSSPTGKNSDSRVAVTEPKQTEKEPASPEPASPEPVAEKSGTKTRSKSAGTESGDKTPAREADASKPEGSGDVPKKTAVKPESQRRESAPNPILPKENPSPARPDSTITVPITVSLGDVINILHLEAKTPRGENFNDFWGPFPNPDSPQALKYKWERHNFALATQRNEALFNTQFNYQFEYAQKRNRPYPPFTCCIWDTLDACGQSDELASSEIVLKTEFALQADWRMTSTSKISVGGSQNCPATETNQPLVELIQSRLVKPLEAFAKGLDEKSTQFVNLKPYVQAAWNMLLEPISFNSDNSLWLDINPRKVKVTPVELNATMASLSIGVEARPRLSVGRKPAASKAKLPDILLGAPEPGFHIVVKTLLGHEQATKVMRHKLTEDPVVFKNKKKSTIEGLRVYGNSIKLIVSMDLAGPFRTRVFFSGKPQYDPESMVMSVPDLDYDLKTRDWLANKAPWMLDNAFVDRVRTAAQWDLSAQVESTNANLEGLINRKFSNKERFSGEIAKRSYQGIGSTHNAFIIRTLAQGELKLFLE